MSENLLSQYDGVLFDLDGVLYAGPDAVPGAIEVLQSLRDQQITVGFLTNNASRSAHSVAAHLQELGIGASADEVVGSGPAGVALMSQHISPGSAVLVTGSTYLRELVQAAGFRPVSDAADQPEAVIQGFDPDLGWKDLAEAAYAINAGARWFATNLDLSIPREHGIAPGNGALAAAISYATAQEPLAAGKPEPVLFHQAADKLGMRRPLMVGDRLDTDILGANRAGFGSALVLTGVDNEENARAAEATMQPNWVLENLPALLNGSHRELQP